MNNPWKFSQGDTVRDVHGNLYDVQELVTCALSFTQYYTYSARWLLDDDTRDDKVWLQPQMLFEAGFTFVPHKTTRDLEVCIAELEKELVDERAFRTRVLDDMIRIFDRHKEQP